MAVTKMNFKPIYQLPAKWVMAGLAIVTLYFQTNLADPFNSAKMWALIFFSSWLMGFIYFYKNVIFSNKTLAKSLYLVLAFLLSALTVTVFTDFKYVAFFGDTQRRNGFLSYFSLALMFIAVIMFIKAQNVKNLFLVTYLVSIVSGIYGFMQTTGRDFVDWVNPHNALIGTQGNPNFSSAVMAIIGTLIFSTIFQDSFSLNQKLIAGLLVIFMFFLIYRSNARQGLLSLILGVSIFLIIWLYIRRRVFGVLASVAGTFVFVLATLGMLQWGPLERYLYKGSVSVRGYYWRAGLEMFKDNPLLGVGMDRYGAYFMHYREVGYPLSYGFDLTSSNAHNTFIQFFATGGFFLGATYLALQIFILITAIKFLRSSQEKNRLIMAGLLASWVAFHAQSLVSIDNLGVSIWGWVLGGSIIGFSASLSEPAVTPRDAAINRNQINLKRVLISTSFAIPAVILISVLYRGENNAFKASIPYESINTSSRELYKQIQINAINSKLIDPSYSIKMAQNLIQAGYVGEGVATLETIHNNDPRNLDAINLLALTFEAYDQIPKAIIYREKMAVLNPWNAVNYLVLGQDYKKQGDMAKTREALDKILSFATGVNGGPIADQARKELE